MKTNYHTHTCLCKHAGGTAAEYAAAAAENGLAFLGFSDHAPFPSEDFGRMTISQLPAYIRDVRALKQQYRGTMDIYCGLEIEYLPGYLDYYEELLTGYGLDYLVLGEHFQRTAGKPNQTIYNAKSTEEYLDYAAAVAEGMQTGYFKYLAHPDLMFINDFAWDTNCDRAVDIILQQAVKQNGILEYNANGMRRQKQEFCDGTRYPYPHPEFWRRVKETGLPVLISSDCHNPDDMWDCYMAEARQDAALSGLNIIQLLDL